jgi:MFS family permease
MEQDEPRPIAEDRDLLGERPEPDDEHATGGSATHLLHHDPYDVLRNVGFRQFLLAGMVSTIGNQMQGVAVGWELYERTNSPFALGMVGLAQVFPVLLLAIPSGHAADRYSRKWQMALALATLLLASIGLAVLSIVRGPVSLTYLLLVLTGVGQALNRPARWAILPQIIDRQQLLSAVTWNTSAWQISAMAGPAVGGLVIAATGGATACYLLNALCSAAAIGLITSLRPRLTARDSQPISVQSLLAGLRFVLRTDLILATITLDLLAVFLGGATALLPVYARDILAIGPTGLGWLRAAPSIGSSAMALLLAHRPPMRQAGKSLLWAVAGFGIATIVFGLSRNPYLSFAMLLLSGAFDNISIVVRQTLVQLLTPDEMRGRVSAVNTIFVASSNELGEFESGVAAGLFGTVTSVVAGGVGTLLVVLGVIKIWPSLPRLRSLHDVRTSRV